MKICKIYLITNFINNKFYIGQTWTTINHRFSQHLCDKRKTYFHTALQKYGKENFKKECIAMCYDQEEADYLESYFINKYNSTQKENGYNLTNGGSSGKHSEKTKIKMSLSKIGNKYGLGNKGRLGHTWKLSEQQKINLRKPIKFTEEQILNIQKEIIIYDNSIFENMELVGLIIIE